MADRRVKWTGKDRDGDIIRLCGEWGRASKQDAIFHIDNYVHTYYVQDRYRQRAEVEVVPGPTGKYLRSDPNSSCEDNLDNLPDC